MPQVSAALSADTTTGQPSLTLGHPPPASLPSLSLLLFPSSAASQLNLTMKQTVSLISWHKRPFSFRHPHGTDTQVQIADAVGLELKVSLINV